MDAMFLGTPVIGTGYGGNMDFMNSSNSYIVNYKEAYVKHEFGPYKKGYKWAEPDVDHAVHFLKKAYNERNNQNSIIINAQNTIKEKYSLNPFKKELCEFIKK